MFSLIYAWTNARANNRDAGDLRRHCAHCDVAVMPNIWGHMTSLTHGKLWALIIFCIWRAYNSYHSHIRWIRNIFWGVFSSTQLRLFSCKTISCCRKHRTYLSQNNSQMQYTCIWIEIIHLSITLKITLFYETCIYHHSSFLSHYHDTQGHPEYRTELYSDVTWGRAMGCRSWMQCLAKFYHFNHSFLRIIAF